MPETFLHGVELLEITDGPRPIRSVRSSVIGLVGNGDFDGANAEVTIGASNSKVRFITTSHGAEANNYSIRCVKPSANNQSLSVTKDGTVITISLATDGSAAATSTATQVATAFNNAALSTKPNGGIGFGATAVVAGSDGTGVYAVHSATSYAGGTDDSFPANTPVLVTSPNGLDDKVGAGTYLGKALEAIFKQAGAVVVVVNGDAIGDATEMTGVFALKKAQSELGYTPRIIACQAADTEEGIANVKSVCSSLKAIAFVGLPVADYAASTDATTWVTDNANERIMAIWPSINNGEDPAPYAAGLLAKSDNDRGFWWSPSNQEVFGITTLDAPVDFQLGDTTSLANILNEGNVTTFIRQGGFRLWGNRTGSIDPKWSFLSVRRTADIINDSIQRAHLWAVDRNITKTYFEDVTESVNAYLRTLQNQGAILGGRCWPDPDLNSPDQIQLGKVYFNFEFTPPYPAEHITFRSELVNDYLVDLV